jgi:hypothetical protein
MIKLFVPTIRDTNEHFYRLFRLSTIATSSRDLISFDFSRCKFLMQNGVALLGGLAKVLEADDRPPVFQWHTMRSEVAASLANNGFLRFFGQPGKRSKGTAAEFRQDTLLEKEPLVAYLVQDWIGMGRIKLSAALKEAIVSTAWEIYANAFEHSQSGVGVFSCGQHYPRKHLLELTVVDFGCGIPDKVRTFLKRPAMSGAEALQWAFRRGTTTSQIGIARGMGLDLLREFVRVNRGQVSIFSHDAYAIIDSRLPQRKNREVIYGKSDVSFSGTIANIVFRCTPHYYSFASEVSSRPLF